MEKENGKVKIDIWKKNYMLIANMFNWNTIYLNLGRIFFQNKNEKKKKKMKKSESKVNQN